MKTKLKVLLLTVTVLLSFTMLFTGCGQKDQDVIRIGAILPLTGPGAQIGEMQRNGLMLAEKDLENDINIKVFYQDSQGSPTRAISILQQFNSMGIDIVIATMSQVANALIPVAETNNQLLFLNSVSFPDITKDRNYIYRMHVTSDSEAKEMVDFISQKSISSIGILYVNDNFGLGAKTTIQNEVMDTNISIDFIFSYEINQSNFNNLVAKVNKNVDAIYVVGYEPTFVNVIRALASSGYDNTILTNMAISSEVYQKEIIGITNRIFYTTTFYEISDDSTKHDFSQKYKKMFNADPTFISAINYDQLHLLAEAINNSKEPGVYGIMKQLDLITNFNGIMGDNLSIQNQEVNLPIVVHELSFKNFN